MARMWRGPCEALRAAHADPLWAAIHRRGGRHFVACNVAPDGRSADFYRLEKVKGEWYSFDLGRVQGGDPHFTVLAGYRRFTPLDAELIQLNAAYLDRVAGDIVLDGRAVVSKLMFAVDQFV
jgi:hypothetical protein